MLFTTLSNHYNSLIKNPLYRSAGKASLANPYGSWLALSQPMGCLNHPLTAR